MERSRRLGFMHHRTCYRQRTYKVNKKSNISIIHDPNATEFGGIWFALLFIGVCWLQAYLKPILETVSLPSSHLNLPSATNIISPTKTSNGRTLLLSPSKLRFVSIARYLLFRFNCDDITDKSPCVKSSPIHKILPSSFRQFQQDISQTALVCRYVSAIMFIRLLKGNRSCCFSVLSRQASLTCYVANEYYLKLGVYSCWQKVLVVIGHS